MDTLCWGAGQEQMRRLWQDRSGLNRECTLALCMGLTGITDQIMPTRMECHED